MPTYPYLSPEWIDAVQEIVANHREQLSTSLPVIRLNQIVADSPFGPEPINAHVDTTSGEIDIGLDHVADPDATISTDYETARSIFAEGQFGKVVGKFLTGKLKVQGDMSKLLSLAKKASGDEAVWLQLADEIRGITA